MPDPLRQNVLTLGVMVPTERLGLQVDRFWCLAADSFTSTNKLLESGCMCFSPIEGVHVYVDLLADKS